jgi:hypothetical protein
MKVETTSCGVLRAASWYSATCTFTHCHHAAEVAAMHMCQARAMSHSQGWLSVHGEDAVQNYSAHLRRVCRCAVSTDT